MHNERGFSVIKFLMLLAALAGGTWYGYIVIPVYNAEWKIQDTFETVARTMSDKSEKEIHQRLPELLRIKYLDQRDVPAEFFQNIQIQSENGRVTISSSYHVTVWPLGPVQSEDPNSDYDATGLKGMDLMRHKLRLDFDFEPYAETP